jgi:hypothetical protein
LSFAVGCFAEIALFEQIILQRLQIICYKRRLMDVGCMGNLKIAIPRPGFRILPETILFGLVAMSMFKLTGRMRKKCEGLR